MNKANLARKVVDRGRGQIGDRSPRHQGAYRHRELDLRQRLPSRHERLVASERIRLHAPSGVLNEVLAVPAGIPLPTIQEEPSRPCVQRCSTRRNLRSARLKWAEAKGLFQYRTAIIFAEACGLVVRRPYADAPVLYCLVTSRVLSSRPEAAARRFS